MRGFTRPQVWFLIAGILLAATTGWAAGEADEPAAACDSLTAAPVLLQKSVKHSRSAPEETGPAALLQADQPSSNRSVLEGLLTTGVGLINPLLESSEEEVPPTQEITYSGDAWEATGLLHNETALHGHGHDGDDEGNIISKAIGSDLLGDSLDPTHHGEGSKDAHPHSHGYASLLFLFGGLTLGSLILMLNERYLPQLPYTCLLFIAGFLIAAVHDLRPNRSWFFWGSWYTSVSMWEAIDPHMLFYIFLPALIFSEAMRLNVHMVKSCFWQIILLAGPGVVASTALLGAFSHYVLPYGWDWPLCLVVGSILSATDPVAVVALFKSLGVSPRLTMVISGESLLNDGTAFVSFSLMLKVVLGAKLTSGGVAIYFANMTILSFITGFVVASIALWIISCLALERGHSDAMIQVVITICCAYLCFFMAESELSTSGILSLVASGFTLAYSVWPCFVSKEVVDTVWEAIEFVGNTMVFLLAGLLFADACFSRMEHILLADIGWLFVMYVAVMIVRTVVTLVLWVPLKLAGQPLSWQEGVVLAWSGIRGAVSLAMAIIVDTEPAISKQMGTRVMFHVGGIAALTLLINATTTARLLNWLGLASEPEERERLLRHLERQMAERTNAAFAELGVGAAAPSAAKTTVGAAEGADLRFVGADPGIVRSMVPVLGHIPPANAVSNRIGAGSLGATRAARAQAYREIFLQVVQNHYWESIEQGIIPRNNAVARILLGSKDAATAEASSSLNDWAHILSHVDIRPPCGISASMANLAQSPALGWFPALPQLFPSEEVIQTWKIYAVLSYQEAHKCARVEVPGYFDDLEELDREVKDLVTEESQQRCKEAARLLHGVEDAAVSYGRSRMLAQKLLRLQLDEVASLEKQGVLNTSEGHHLGQSIHDSLLHISRAETHSAKKI